jgi:hypothetical protein
VGFVGPCLFELFISNLLVPLVRVLSSMAYNREWDMGKETWRDGDSWGAGSGKGRDDDYGEGKKRKFNNTVCNHCFGPPLLT